jgi:diaminopimelate decarboxylase
MGKGVAVESPAIGGLMGFLNSGSYGYSASPLLFLGHNKPYELVADKKEIICSMAADNNGK